MSLCDDYSRYGNNRLELRVLLKDDRNQCRLYINGALPQVSI